MTLLSTALTALLASVAAQGVAGGSWTEKPCLRLVGDIEIATEADLPEKVPDTAEGHGYCDETQLIPMTLRWDEKELNFFVKTDNSSKTFQLHMIQYIEGQKTWFTTPRGIRGNIGGEVKCLSPMDFNLRIDDQSGGTSEISGNRSSNVAPIARRAPGRVRKTAGDAPKRVSLSNLSLTYSKDITSRTESVSVCRMEADLTVVLGISGAITACALLAAAAVAAPRLLC